jgi:signal peptidase II
MPRMTTSLTKHTAFWPAALAIVIGDYASKRVAEAALALHVPREVMGDWVRFTLTYNTGAAMNVSLGGFSRVGLSLVAVAMIGVLVRLYRAAAPTDAWQALALGLVCGGAVGNLLDRLRSARGVVDFIDVGTASWRFWTFNVADAGVTVGALLLAAIYWRRPAEAPVADGASAPVDLAE